MRRSLLTLAALSVVDAITLYISQSIGPFPSIVPLGNPTAYRNLYVHVPISVATYLLFTIAFLFALAFLLKRYSRLEDLAHSFILAGLVMGFATLVTGIIWAQESWGAAWNWDPRETGVLFMFLAFLVYLAIRSSVNDPDVRPKVSMAFAVAAYSTIPLSFLVPYLMPSLHPTIPETSMFLRGGLAPAIFGGRVVLVSAEAVLLTLLIRSKRSRKTLLAVSPVLFAAIFLLALQLPPNLVGERPDGAFKVQVVSGNLSEGILELKVKASGVTYNLFYAGKPPINPLFVTFEGEKKLTLEKHWLLVEGKVRGNLIEASIIRLIPYWGNPVNSLMYALTLMFLAYLSGRERR